jgi:lipoate-protein ligase A
MSIFAALDVYCDDASRSAAMNMAIDEALLQNAKVASLRFYRWDHAALSFGYFGKFTDVEAHGKKRELVRRWTGGGIVLHGDDLTYSIVIPAGHPAFAYSTMSIYEKVHEALRKTLGATGQHAELATVAAVYDRRSSVIPSPAVAGRNLLILSGSAARDVSTSLDMKKALIDRGHNQNDCFANPVRADVLLNGEKVAGAAQRKTRAGLLQQGSIQNVDLPEDFGERFAAQLTENCDYRQLNGAVLERATEIAAQKYGTDTWLRKR